MNELTSNIYQLVKSVNNQLLPIVDIIKQINLMIPTWINEHPKFIESIKNLSKKIKQWPEAQRIILKEFALYGWFINWETELNLPDQINLAKKGDGEGLNKYMINHLKNDWDEIVKHIITFCPERREILQTAFDLHHKGIYIASIPLFLAQSDGICAHVLGKQLFAREEGKLATSIKLDELLSNGELTKGSIVDVFLEPLRTKNQYSEGSSRHTPKKKGKGPNRNGILHGSSKHLDYGTELNSYKSFSLLAYIVFMLEDFMKDNNK